MGNDLSEEERREVAEALDLTFEAIGEPENKERIREAIEALDRAHRRLGGGGLRRPPGGESS